MEGLVTADIYPIRANDKNWMSSPKRESIDSYVGRKMIATLSSILTWIRNPFQLGSETGYLVNIGRTGEMYHRVPIYYARVEVPQPIFPTYKNLIEENRRYELRNIQYV